jgi:hypothetical protein
VLWCPKKSPNRHVEILSPRTLATDFGIGWLFPYFVSGIGRMKWSR